MAQCVTYILVLVDLLLSSEIIEALPSTVKTFPSACCNLCQCN